jgi:archaellum component FlaC
MDFIIIIPTAVSAVIGYLYMTTQSDIRSRLTKLETTVADRSLVLARLDREIGILQSQNSTQLRAVEKLETQIDDMRDYR